MSSFREQMNEGNVAGIDVVQMTKAAQDRGAPKVYSAHLLPPFINRQGFMNLHDENRKADEKLGAVGMGRSRSTMRPSQQHGPAPPIMSLLPTSIRTVARKVNHIHSDSILFLRTIHETHRIVGTNLLVEDDDGDCLMLSLYNFVSPNEDPRDVFPVTTYLALLAPFMKNSGDDPNRNLLLRCDNPECVRIFPTRLSWLAAKKGKRLVDTKGVDPAHLRTEGNTAFLQERYHSAARCYSRALECTSIEQDDKVACLSNLAEVRLRQERWEEAKMYAKTVLEIDPTHRKAKYRLAMSNIRLLHFKDASAIVEDIEGQSFKCLQLEITRLLQEQAGNYNIQQMRDEAAMRTGHALTTFHANYVSIQTERGVTITKPEGCSYRGTIAKKDISGNTMLASSKALVFCPAEKSSFDFSHDPYTKVMLKTSSMALENELILLMYHRPAMRSIVYSLSSGVSDLEPGNSKIDIERIRGVACSNVFGSMETDAIGDQWEHLQSLHCGGDTSQDADYRKWMQGSGLWINESLFNHSCVPNCTWRQIGDQLFIWSTRDIAAGEETTISYTPPGLSYSERKSRFNNWVQPNVGFVCQCEWCYLLRTSEEWRALEQRAHEAFKDAATLVSTRGIKMATAAQKCMSSLERKAAIKSFSQLSPSLQHNACANLWVMEGACEAANGNHHAALLAYEKAASIKYDVRGDNGIERAKDLWRIVGALMACDKPGKALEILSTIYKDIFVKSLVKDVSAAFHMMTLHYAMPWWEDTPSVHRSEMMEGMIGRVLSGNKKTRKASRR